jgi:hypothetical protein
MAEGTNYLIEKAFKNGETIFEHALCLDCHAQCIGELSTESLQRIHHFFQERVDVETRRFQALEKFGMDHQQWIGHCMLKGYPLRECDEYQLYAFCIDRDLVFNGAPYMVCGEAIDEIIDLLSSETLGALGDLADRLFGIGAPRAMFVF